MTDLKALARKFKTIADDWRAVAELADNESKSHPFNVEYLDLCNRMRKAGDGDSVRAISDEILSK